MNEKNKQNVVISLNEYKEFIINQYETGKYKSNLNEEIRELELEKSHMCDYVVDNANMIKSNINNIIELSMETDTFDISSKGEALKQLDKVINNKDTFIRYEFFNERKLKTVIEIGIKENEIKDFINNYFNTQEEVE